MHSESTVSKRPFHEMSEFKKLKAEWDKKLKDSGFEDIETDGDESKVRPQIIKTNKTQYHGGNSYFDFCQEILRNFDFRRELDRKIFEQHTYGKSLRDIEEWLKSNSLRKLKSRAIGYLINRIKSKYLMGAK